MGSSMRTRRFKPILVLVVLFALTILYVSSSARATRSSDFYRRTQVALNEQRSAGSEPEPALAQKQKQKQTPLESGSESGSDSGADVPIAQRLRDAEAQAKAAADRRGDEHRARLGMDELPEKEAEDSLRRDDDADDAVAGSGKGAKNQRPRAANAVPVADAVAAGGEDGVARKPGFGAAQRAADGVGTEMDGEVEAEMNSILKRSPIIIFSKTYCRYSKMAKNILLEKYKITPAPFVVELDEHALGPELQAKLAETTGRTTVPNVLINGKSIGGGDDVQRLHEDGQIIETVKTMGGKRIMEARMVSDEVETEFKKQ